MSKLFNEYQIRKQKNPEKLYLFKSGIFYISLNEDAKKLSELFQFKITPLNDTVTKCGFPAKRLEFYTNLLQTCCVDFEIVDPNHNKIENLPDYLKDSKIKETLKTIEALDMNTISFQKAFEILKDLQENIKSLSEGVES